MKIHNIQQSSDEWLYLRRGKITSCDIKKVMSEPKTKKDKAACNLSSTAESYAYTLISEIMGTGKKTFEAKATEWGNKNEDIALARYGLLTNNYTAKTGLIESDCGRMGYSPDELITHDELLCIDNETIHLVKGSVEVKCPYDSAKHFRWICENKVPDEHYDQCMFGIMVADLDFCDFVSFDPTANEKKLFIKRLYRDDKYIAYMEDKISNFLGHLDYLLELIRVKR